MKVFSRKTTIIAASVLLVLSSYALFVQADVTCPRCHGSGQIASSSCSRCGGAGNVQPNVTIGLLQLGSSLQQTNLSRIIHNNEAVDVYCEASATINTQKKVLTETSNRTLLKANSDTLLLITFNGLKDENYFTHQMDITFEPITCPDCQGSGGAGTLTVCPQCGGTGYVSQAASGGFDFAGLAAPVAGVAVAAALLVSGFLVVKTRRLTEAKLRSFTSSEFKSWVIGRLHGSEASVLDARKGIDGFAGDGSGVAVRQDDNVGKLQVDAFLNSLSQVKARQGIFVAFSFSGDASAAVVRGRINYRIDVKLVTVKELLNRKEPVMP